jgi:DNA adenine methylase
MQESKPEKKLLVSPLRYPGGKAFLAPYVESILLQNELRPKVFVEPFAGGASVSLWMLGRDLVDKIALYDIDPLVAGFWWTVFNRKSDLSRRVETEPVDISNWNRLKQQRINGHSSNAWKCLFLNRTSFSGILAPSSGPIGGKSQTSAYRLDCRYYKETILGRIDELWRFRDRVYDVDTKTYSETLKMFERKTKLEPCFYFDPPFFHKADKLYNYFFAKEEHEIFLQRIRKLPIPWVLSYDYCSEVIVLLRRLKLKYRLVPVSYTASSKTAIEPKMEIVSSNLQLPRIRKK